MEQITKTDLSLVSELSSRTYSGNKLLSNASEEEKSQLQKVKLKLKAIAEVFANKYSDVYGPFKVSYATGNDIAIGGIKFKGIWSGIYKGAENKQYASQISFAINPKENCLDIGFYFGRASGHSLNKEQRIELEEQLKMLGISLSNTIVNNKGFRQRYFDLFDYGFTAYFNDHKSSSEDWYNKIKINPKCSHIIVRVYPNDFEVIENSTIDSFVSNVIFLMGGISNHHANVVPIIKPITPEQMAKRAERLAEIGNKGELYIIEQEQEKLKSLGFINTDYPKHVALESTAYGFDIISLDKNKQEIFIEVKTTTRIISDPSSKKFFMSLNEFEVYQKNKLKFKLYRVYDIENSPNFEELDLKKINRIPDGFVCKY